MSQLSSLRAFRSTRGMGTSQLWQSGGLAVVNDAQRRLRLTKEGKELELQSVEAVEVDGGLRVRVEVFEELLQDSWQREMIRPGRREV